MKEIEELSGLLDREGIQNLGKELGHTEKIRKKRNLFSDFCQSKGGGFCLAQAGVEEAGVSGTG